MLNKEKTITISLDEYNRLLESQKQVDDLLNRRIEPKIFHCHADALETCPKVEKAVKDTAEEILQELWDETEATENDEWVRAKIKEIAKSKGVEVE